MNANATASKFRPTLRSPVRTAPPAPRPSCEQVARRRWFAPAAPARIDQVVGSLYARHHAAVTAYLMRHGIAPEDAKDLCADTFVVALKRLPTFQGASSISTWLFGIARKLASDQRRSARARREVLVDETPEETHGEDPLQHLEHLERKEAIASAVAALKPTQRAVVQRFVLDEEPMAEVAKEGAVPAQTAYARLYAAQAVLRSTLAQDC
jgi:RNA polymerase sigma-70 factor (ECF subfamily)